jgi:hypothetical protein
MADYRKLLRSARERTEPSEDTIRALEAVVREPPRPVDLRPRVATALVALAAAAAAAVLVSWPAERVDRTLHHDGEVALGSLVRIDAGGEGHVEGDVRVMDVAWFAGTLGVEVEPDQGVRLSVQTPEGTVRVVGTGFDVTRDALGTSVVVHHGKVAVSCKVGGAHTLEAGQSTMCFPTTAAGALARVLALRSTAEPDALLRELDHALVLPDATGPIAAELRAFRAGARLSGGDEAGALQEAEATLALPDVTRAEELHRLAARLRVRAGDCPGALPHLRALEAAGTLGEDAPALADCAR